MPQNLNDVKPEDIDPKFEAAEKVVGETPSIVGAVIGVSAGSAYTYAVNKFAATQPAEKQNLVKYGLKTVGIIGSLAEIAGAASMREGSGKKAALFGGVTFVATEVVDIVGDVFALKGVVFPKDGGSNPKKYNPKGRGCPPCEPSQPPVAPSEPPASAEPAVRGH